MAAAASDPIKLAPIIATPSLTSAHFFLIAS